MRHSASMSQVQVLVISVSADDPLPNGARPSAGRLLTEKLQYFFQLSLDLCLFFCYLCGMDDIIPYGRRDSAKISRHFEC